MIQIAVFLIVFFTTLIICTCLEIKTYNQQQEKEGE